MRVLPPAAQDGAQAPDRRPGMGSGHVAGRSTVSGIGPVRNEPGKRGGRAGAA
ncbi:MAG: hypothetical protein MPJ25_00335 [Pirellulales bacterium]|nr:hypothetical protein [Pirellulales bacterium]